MRQLLVSSIWMACALAPLLFAQADTTKVVFVAGKRSHGYFSHDHKAGCHLLADALEASGLGIQTQVVYPGWPEDQSVFEDADVVVVYSDGAGRNPLNGHLPSVDKLMDRGVGLVCLHFAVETPKGETGDHFLKWLGGYFETFWSVNPHWTAKFDSFPDHPISRGVRPFEIKDEWYYHMRFRSGLKGVTPILTDLPPAETLTSRKPGPHSGNPSVYAAVLERKEPQHVAWASERSQGGRAFGFTGGHNHENWAHPDFRKVVLNAVVWCAGLEVPETGVRSRKVTLDDLKKNMDDKKPLIWRQQAEIEKKLSSWAKQP